MLLCKETIVLLTDQQRRLPFHCHDRAGLSALLTRPARYQSAPRRTKLGPDQTALLGSPGRGELVPRHGHTASPRAIEPKHDRLQTAPRRTKLNTDHSARPVFLRQGTLALPHHNSIAFIKATELERARYQSAPRRSKLNPNQPTHMVPTAKAAEDQPRSPPGPQQGRAPREAGVEEPSLLARESM